MRHFIAYSQCFHQVLILLIFYVKLLLSQKTPIAIMHF